MKVLEVVGLTKVYGKGAGGSWGVKGSELGKKDFVAVDNISFSLEKGEIVGFLGPNGAGKTTTIQMLLWFFSAMFEKSREMGLGRLE